MATIKKASEIAKIKESGRIVARTLRLVSETIVPGKRPIMSRWRSRLFAFLARNAQTAAAFFGLPANRVVELGLQVEL